jgi:hypothetical protein
MKRLLKRQPSPALIIAMIALFAAAGGTALATGHSKHPSDSSSDKRIASSAAKSYFNKHIGKASVLHAKKADGATTATSATHATTAGSATTAASATTAGSATTASNASALQGYAANSLVRANSSAMIVNASSTPVNQTLLTSTAPVNGGMLLQVNFTCASFSGAANTRWDITPKVDGTAAGNGLVLFFPHANVTSQVGDSAGGSVYVPVTAGSHVFSYTGIQTAGDGSLDCDIYTSTLFVPFGDTGAVGASRPAEPAAGHRHPFGAQP